jgi:hypothetical protein
MKLANRAAGIAASPHAGRAVKVVRILNLVGTIRGALTTVLLAVSAIGGVATVNTVRQDIVNDSTAPRATQMPRSAAPTATATPLTASGLRADIQKRLDAALAADTQAVEDLRKVAVFSGARLDQLMSETKQRLQARYEQGGTQLTTLIEGSDAAAASSAPTAAPASPNVTAAYALLQVITGDLNQIVVQATRAATEPTPVPRPPTPRPDPPTLTPVPTRTLTPVPTRTPTPAPTASRTPTPRPTPTH